MSYPSRLNFRTPTSKSQSAVSHVLRSLVNRPGVNKASRFYDVTCRHGLEVSRIHSGHSLHGRVFGSSQPSFRNRFVENIYRCVRVPIRLESTTRTGVFPDPDGFRCLHATVRTLLGSASRLNLLELTAVQVGFISEEGDELSPRHILLVLSVPPPPSILWGLRSSTEESSRQIFASYSEAPALSICRIETFRLSFLTMPTQSPVRQSPCLTDEHCIRGEILSSTEYSRWLLQAEY